jgi:hypothetical protein
MIEQYLFFIGRGQTNALRFVYPQSKPLINQDFQYRAQARFVIACVGDEHLSLDGASNLPISTARSDVNASSQGVGHALPLSWYCAPGLYFKYGHDEPLKRRSIWGAVPSRQIQMLNFSKTKRNGN